ncbi:Dabb family protein [Clostridium carnis]
MIKHIVMWKLLDTSEGNTKIQNALEIKQRLEKLPSIISELKMIEVGINIEESNGAYDIVLISEFNNKFDLEIYQKHPKHLEIVEFVNKVKEERVVVDYEI